MVEVENFSYYATSSIEYTVSLQLFFLSHSFAKGASISAPNFSVETIAGNVLTETLLLVRGTANVVAVSNLGIGWLLIICSSIRDKASLRKVLSGELALMFCFLAVALFNTFNAGTIVDGGPPLPFWIILIVNPLLCIYGLVNNKN